MANLDKDSFNAKAKELSENGQQEETEDFVEDVVDESAEDYNVAGEVDVLEDDPEIDDAESSNPVNHHTTVTSKEQRAIIALKKELKETKEQMQALMAGANDRSVSEQKNKLVQKYIGQGYDEDFARTTAEQELKMAAIEKRIARFEFQTANASLFAKYPQLNQNLDLVMRNVQNTGMTADRICLAMFGAPQEANPEKTRAQAAAVGALAEQSNTTITSVYSDDVATKPVALSALDRRKKQEFEELFGAISNERFLELKKQHNL